MKQKFSGPELCELLRVMMAQPKAGIPARSLHYNPDSRRTKNIINSTADTTIESILTKKITQQWISLYYTPFKLVY